MLVMLYTKELWQKNTKKAHFFIIIVVFFRVFFFRFQSYWYWYCGLINMVNVTFRNLYIKTYVLTFDRAKYWSLFIYFSQTSRHHFPELIFFIYQSLIYIIGIYLHYITMYMYYSILKLKAPQPPISTSSWFNPSST